MEMKDMYYQCREGDFYTTYTKKEIDNLIDLDNFSTWFPFLKDMDYPAMPEVYESKKNFHKYIAVMRLASYRAFGWADGLWASYRPTNQTTCIQLTNTTAPDKITLVRRADGDWDCITELMGYGDGKYFPVRVSGVVDKGNVPALLEFKLNDGCLYKVEVIKENDTNE